MPTGYTQPIYDNKGITFVQFVKRCAGSGPSACTFQGNGITFFQFVKRCARAFGAFVHMRDDALDNNIPIEKVSTYHKDEMERAAKNLEKATSLTAKEAEKLAAKSYEDQVSHNIKMEKEGRDLSLRYSDMILSVRGWKAPTSQHEGLKKFMLEQLESGLKYDCDHEGGKPTRLTGSQYREKLMEEAARMLEYHSKEWKEQVKLNNERNEWIKQLLDSLK